MTDNHDKVRAMAPRPKAARGLPRAGAGQRNAEDGGRLTTPVVGESLRPQPDWIAALPDPNFFLAARRKRRRSFFGRLALFVLAPTVVALIYFFFVATPVSTAEFKVTYQTYKAPTSLAGGLVETFAGTSQSNNIDLGAILYEYIRSSALLEKLDHELNLRAHYSNPDIDYFSRMSANASSETLLRHYRWRVTASEGLGGYVTVKVEAFDPQFAVKLAQAIVKACDEMMDGMTARARRDVVDAADAEVTRQEARLRQARQALTDFQNQHGDLDPNRGAAQLGQIVGTLESELASERAQLTNTSPTLSDTSPIVIGIKSRVASLEEQLQKERARLAGTAVNAPYSQILDEYSALQLDAEFAKTAYTAAEQGLSVARADAARTQNYLVVFAPPTEATSGSLSIPIVCTVSTFFGALLLYAMGSLLVGAFRDQAGY